MAELKIGERGPHKGKEMIFSGGRWRTPLGLARRRQKDNASKLGIPNPTRVSLRTEILHFLGDKCRRCGFDDPRALQIDHINGGGTRERKLKHLMAPSKYLRHIINQNYEGYQLLCANCNWIKRSEQREYANGGKYG